MMNTKFNTRVNRFIELPIKTCSMRKITYEMYYNMARLSLPLSKWYNLMRKQHV